MRTICFNILPVNNSNIRKTPSYPPEAMNLPFGEISTEFTLPI